MKRRWWIALAVYFLLGYIGSPIPLQHLIKDSKAFHRCRFRTQLRIQKAYRFFYAPIIWAESNSTYVLAFYRWQDDLIKKLKRHGRKNKSI